MITYEDFRDKRREYAFTKSVSKDPKDQDAARKIRTQMDYDDLKKQIGSKKKPQVAANAVVEGDYHSGQGEKIQARTKKWMDKKGQKGAPGLDAMKARTAEHKAKRGVKEGTDKAFEYVKKQIAAKYGKDSYVSKDNPRKPQTAAQKKAYAAHKAKLAKQDHRDPTEKASDGRYSDRHSNRGSD